MQVRKQASSAIPVERDAVDTRPGPSAQLPNMDTDCEMTSADEQRPVTGHEMVGKELFDFYRRQTTDLARFEQRGVWPHGNCGYMSLAWTLLLQTDQLHCTQSRLHVLGMGLRRELAEWWRRHTKLCNDYLVCLSTSADPSERERLSAQVDAEIRLVALAHQAVLQDGRSTELRAKRVAETGL